MNEILQSICQSKLRYKQVQMIADLLQVQEVNKLGTFGAVLNTK